MSIIPNTSMADIQVALQYISPDISREEWVNLGMAIQNELGDAGFELFDTWSSGGKSYNPKDTESAWKSFDTGGGITSATLFKMAKEGGYTSRKNRQVDKSVTKPPKPTETEAEITKRREKEDREQKEIQRQLNKAKPCTSHQHTDRKGVTPIDALELDGNMILPMRRVDTKDVGAEIITPEGDKKCLPGSKKAGSYFVIGKSKNDTIIITEGYTTGLSIHEATDNCVLVAFGKSNLPNVAASIRKRLPKLKIILAPDNDENKVAIKIAVKAALKYGCEVVYPQFPDGTPGTDFNDLHQRVGIDEVTRQIENNQYRPSVDDETDSKSLLPLHDCVVTCLSEVESKPLTWLWPSRFPLGKLTLIGGKPALGKTQIALLMAATVTKGGSWPYSNDRSPKGDVLILSSEDDVADTIKPRLQAVGANVSRVHVLQAVNEFSNNDENVVERQFSLSRHIQQMIGLLRTNPSIRLMIFDPLSAYLGVKDSHRDADVREVLGPLSQIAAEFSVTVLGIVHLNKSLSTDPIARFMGSTGVIASARAAYLVDGDDEEKLFLPVKANLSEPLKGLTYCITEVELPGGIITSKVEWTGETDKQASDVLAKLVVPPKDRPALEGAKDWLNDFLKHGPAKANEVKHAHKECPYSWATIRRAARELEIKSVKRGKFHESKWYWMTPEQAAIPEYPDQSAHKNPSPT